MHIILRDQERGSRVTLATCADLKSKQWLLREISDEDDAWTIFDKMIRADAIVYATPLYCWSFTSQMKPLIDRHFCLVSDDGTPDHNSLISGKSAALLVSCAGPVEGNCDAIQHIFAGFTDYLKLTWKGNFILPFCSTPDAVGDEGSELAANLARAIT